LPGEEISEELSDLQHPYRAELTCFPAYYFEKLRIVSSCR